MPSNAVDTKVFVDRAQRYCAAAERCPSDVVQLLHRLGASAGQTDEIIGLLQQQDYLNTTRYCKAFVHDKVAFQGWGRVKIAAALRAKHLPEQQISEALQEIDEAWYGTNVRKLLSSRHGQERQRIIRFMLQRGFTFDDLQLYADYETDD